MALEKEITDRDALIADRDAQIADKGTQITLGPYKDYALFTSGKKSNIDIDGDGRSSSIEYDGYYNSIFMAGDLSGNGNTDILPVLEGKNEIMEQKQQSLHNMLQGIIHFLDIMNGG